jgi:hypothetical protein
MFVFLKKIQFVAMRLLPYLFFVVVLSACNYGTEMQTINAANKFSLSIPPWLEEEKGLKEGAEFQYANRFRNFYVVGETLKSTDSTTAAKLIKSFVQHLRDTAVMKDALLTDSAAFSTNGANGVRAEVFGKMDGESIYFSEVVVQGKNGFYHISVWTRSEERKLRFKNDITAILESFKEI